METLTGWKEIATFLRQGIRTVQRWELIGLPIHRIRHSSRSPVIAFREELDAWSQASHVRVLDEVLGLKEEVKALKAEVASLKRATRRQKRTKRKH